MRGILARLFYGSVVAGIVLCVLAAGVFPLPQHERYRSSISVIPDGGREESFTIRWPQDRIQLIDPSSTAPLAAAGAAAVLLTGPVGTGAVAASAEVFRLRDTAGNVIGLASRSTSGRRSSGTPQALQGTDWVLLLPSRGTLFMTQLNSRDVAPRANDSGAGLMPAADAPGFWSQGSRLRITGGQGGMGQVLGGSEEFAGLAGTYEENWELEEVAANGLTRGLIRLVTRIEATR